MAKKKKAAVPEGATPSEDAYTAEAKELMGGDYSEPEVVSDPEPDYPTEAGPAPTAAAIASAVLGLAETNCCTDYRACRDQLKAAQDEFAKLWHKAYS